VLLLRRPQRPRLSISLTQRHRLGSKRKPMRMLYAYSTGLRAIPMRLRNLELPFQATAASIDAYRLIMFSV